jgi:hypothetical protein
MIDLHYWPAPNGWNVSVTLGERGLPCIAWKKAGQASRGLNRD